MKKREKFSERELIEELERREREITKPVQLDNPDLTRLRAVCQERIDCLAAGDFRSTQDYYIYETAMKTIFGKDVFKFINECLP